VSPAPLPASTDWVPLGSANVVGFADEVGYGERQANVATAAAAGFANGADLLATALSFTADGATAYMVEFYVPSVTNGGAANYTGFSINLDGAQYGKFLPGYGAFNAINAHGRQKIVPPAGMHTLNIRMYSEGAWTSTAYGGTGGSNNCNPIFVRLTRVSPYTPPGANPVSYATSLPASPVDGQEAILVDSITNPTYQWRFRYNAGSTSAYKWEFVGGLPARVVDFSGAWKKPSANNVYQFISGFPSFTIPRNGLYRYTFGAISGSGTGAAIIIGVGPTSGSAVQTSYARNIPGASTAGNASSSISAIADDLLNGTSRTAGDVMGILMQVDNISIALGAFNVWLEVTPSKVA